MAVPPAAPSVPAGLASGRPSQPSQRSLNSQCHRVPAPTGRLGSLLRTSVRVAVQCWRPSLTGFPALESSGLMRGPCPSAEAQGHWTRCPAHFPTGRTAQGTRIPKRLPAETSLPPPDLQKQRSRLGRSAWTDPRGHSPGGSTFTKASSTFTATLGDTPDHQLRNESTRPSGHSQDSSPGLSDCKALPGSFSPRRSPLKGQNLQTPAKVIRRHHLSGVSATLGGPASAPQIREGQHHTASKTQAHNHTHHLHLRKGEGRWGRDGVGVWGY